MTEQEADEQADESVVYQTTPLLVPPNPSARRIEVLHRILEETADSDNLFMDRKFETREDRKDHIASILSRPDTMAFEVWQTSDGELDLAGIIYFTRVVSGSDAVGHYIFFDGTLGADKTQLMRRTIAWAFEDHEELRWEALHRLTVEVPDYAFALAQHAQKRLGFGGPYEYEMKNKSIGVEGVKREAIEWRGDRRDLLTLGLKRSDFLDNEDT